MGPEQTHEDLSVRDPEMHEAFRRVKALRLTSAEVEAATGIHYATLRNWRDFGQQPLAYRREQFLDGVARLIKETKDAYRKV